jgi:SNF2 family DNA or RNA helicase
MPPILPADLKDYQQRTVRRISSPAQSGLVVAHGTGTGKTRQAIESYRSLGLPTTAVVPAALKANYIKELQKWTGGVPDNVNILSQQAVARNGLGKFDPKNGLLVVDEGHRAREGSGKLIQALQQSQAKKRLLLTATPIFNHPKDIASLVNLAAGKPLLPQDQTEFENKFIRQRKVNPNIFQRVFMGVKPGLRPELTNQKELGKILRKYVDYYGGSTEGFPSVKEEVVNVPMGAGQTDIYNSIMGRAPAWVRWKVKMGLPPGRGELASLRAFLGGARQVSNTSQGFVKDDRQAESAKLQKAFQYLRGQLNQNPNYKGVVYSNYLNSGLDPYKKMLKDYGVPYGEFSGALPAQARNQMVKDYNANKLRALLISSAGAEGLDLKGTRLVQILEPHFNEEKEKQIIGRASRYLSHAGLPPEEQNVLVQRYLAQPRAGLFNRLFGRDTVLGTDEYIREMAKQKSLLNNEVTRLMQRNQQL